MKNQLMIVKGLTKIEIMNPKLIVFDLDGTLLDDKKKISNANKDSITKLKESGISIAIATARPLMGFAYVRNLLNLYDLKSYFISLCGSMISDGYGNLIDSNPVDIIDFIKIDKLAKKENLQAAFYTDYDVYINGEVISDALLHDLNNLNFVAKNINEYKDDNPVGKFVVFGDNRFLDIFESKYGNILSEKFFTMRNNNYMYEIHNKKAGKLSGYKKLLSYTGIDNDEALAFGDSVNDIKLLNYIGYGVAPRSAKDEVKKIADYVSKFDNNSDFIANFLNNIN